VLAAVRDLGRFARTLPEADGRACLADVAELIQRIGTPHHFDDWIELDRIEAIMPAAELLDARDSVRLYYGEALLRGGRQREAATVLGGLVDAPKLGALAQTALAGIVAEKALPRRCIH
jgi:hypothetical protein